MIGQGRPSIALRSWGSIAPRPIETFIRTMLVAVSLCAPLLSAPSSLAQTTDVRLRIAWGGGAARWWQGSISINKGTFSEVAALGLEADEPGSLEIVERSIRISQRSARVYDGVDLRVVAPPDAVLTVTLSPRNVIAVGRHVEIPISDLIDQIHISALDDDDNRLLVRRAAGDVLRVAFDRDHLVFTPREPFNLKVTPHLAGISANASLRCKLRLVEARGDEELWSDEKNVRADDDGALDRIDSFIVPMPEEEGVYDIHIALVPRRFSAPFVRVKSLVERRIQVVVIQTQAETPDASQWKELVEIDPAHPGWWERLKQMPKLKLIPGFGRESLNNGLSRVEKIGTFSGSILAPGGWQAYPLPIDELGKPHILEVEYPGNIPQTLGISVIEPNAAGLVVPLGLDSGFDVGEKMALEPQTTKRRRLIFWPNTKMPLVMLINRRAEGEAVFGKIRLLSGPSALPHSSLANSAPDERLLAAYFDRPLFAENFCSDEFLDPAAKRTLDDWVTFHRGGARMVEYLKHVGFNAAAISVVSEGSALFPSQLLEPTPKSDTGLFFSSGQDPLRKDVLEMLLRLFDREGMTLIAAVQFSAPLPQLEQLRRQGKSEAVGLELMDSSAKTWLQQNRPHRGMAPYYNPLDERVQQAMIEVIQEIAQRYGHHRSFGGVALQLDRDSYACLPGSMWGLDDRTIARFEKERGVNIPDDSMADRFAQRGRFLQDRGSKDWLDWRAEKLAQMYIAMQQALGRNHQGAKLYLAGANMFGDATPSLRPSLPEKFDLGQAMLELGVSPKRYRDQADIVLLQPRRIAPHSSTSSQRANLILNQSAPLKLHLEHPELSGNLFYHETTPLPLPSFDAMSPFGKENTQLVLVAHMPPSGWRNRERFVRSLAALDSQVMFDGGWMIPLGQEEAITPFAEVFRRLPAKPFQTVSPESDLALRQSLVVRKLRQGEQTYVYVVNNSPWALSAELRVSGPTDFQITLLGQQKVATVRREGQSTIWQIDFEPYDIVAATLNSPEAEIDDWTVLLPDSVTVDLQRRVNDIRIRVSSLRNPQPLQTLKNAAFESPHREQRLPGWISGGASSSKVEIDSQQKHQGESSLRLHSDEGVAWVRSDPFDIPRTGRLSVWAWLRIDNEENQPPLRLAIEGKLNGQVYYRFAMVGTGDQAPPLKTEWAPYLFHIDDLPANGLSELRVGFDLMGAGEVWIDDVQLFDLWFYPNERDELLKNIALADFQRQAGNLGDCNQFLNSYWPQFLREHVPIQPRMARNPKAQRAPMGDSPAEPSKEPSNWQRIKNLLPKKVWPF